MGARLNGYVHVVELDDKGQQTGRSEVFGPGCDLPEWAVNAISNDDVWEGAPPARKAPHPTAQVANGSDDELARLRAEVEQLRAERDGRSTSAETAAQSTNAVPPKGGPGSGAPAWRDYAASKGVRVADDASREAVIDALTEAGVPTE